MHESDLKNPEVQNALDHKVGQIKGFYINLTVYVAIFFGCVIAWLAMGGGAFWPIWVLLGCGIAAFSEGLRIGMLPVLADILPFLREDWEEKQKKRLVKNMTKESASTTIKDATSHDSSKDKKKKGD